MAIDFKKVNENSSKANPSRSKPKGARKYIFVSGGVISGLGKGILVSSIGNLLMARGYNVAPIKIDGYLNVDAGTMNPYEHGEVFVLDDGTECDMDLGNYERFISNGLEGENNMTTGKVMRSILEKERKGEYLGKTVQMIPHVTGEIKRRIRDVADRSDAEVCLIEVGGTVGDLENLIFIEAAREMRREEGRNNLIFIHLTLVPVVSGASEQKSKPTQHSVKDLMALGIQPDIVIARANEMLNESIVEKIKLFCNVDYVFSDPDLKSTYEAPLFFEKAGLINSIEECLNLTPIKPDISAWQSFVDSLTNPEKEITVAITGKYTALRDSYTSIFEALDHCASHFKCNINIKWIDTTDLTYNKAKNELSGIDGIIVPGGFGSRGAEGKINCIRVARESNIPFLGLCLGFQMAVLDFARNVCGIKDACSAEFDENCEDAVIDIMPEQKKISGLGGSMRLGACDAILRKGSIVSKLYGSENVSERHRHRFEVNPDYIDVLESKGLVFSGKSPDRKLMEFLELPEHKFFVATQAHPEFKSRPLEAHPLFRGFVESCIKG